MQTIRGYELKERIGSGSFGVVYRAYQAIVGREVAIKIIQPDYANRPDFVKLFEKEAELVASLEHPFIVPLYDYWRNPDGAYLVMRYLRGSSLTKLIKGGRIDPMQVLAILNELTLSLSFAHRRGIVHRDIKPDNILLDDDGHTYLSDFGIARLVGQKTPDDDGISGTFRYISPEQLRELPPTPSMDLYSLGLIAYELFTGMHPFETDNFVELIQNHLHADVANVTTTYPDLPESLNKVIAKATAKVAQDRYQDAREFYFAVQRALQPELSTQSTRIPTEIINPFKGLRPFYEADAIDFFGRSQLTDKLIHRLAEDVPYQRFLAVVGPSGSGKSSAVRAGLIPALANNNTLASENWYILRMLPGAEPMRQLENVLTSIATSPPTDLLNMLYTDDDGLVQAAEVVMGDVDGDILLFIDQFEELFTLTDAEEERDHFLRLVYQAVTSKNSRLRVVIALRADFTDRPLAYPDFGSLIQTRTEFVLPLTPDEIGMAIVGPAERVGLEVEPSLIAAIVSDLKEEPGALPLLQYSLTEVFERREGMLLTLEGYHQSGGISGALAQRAEDAFATLTQEQQQLTRQLFLRLVTLGEGKEDTRRRTRLSELMSLIADADTLQTILDQFGRFRLLTFDSDRETREPTIEIAHEALIREWGRFRQWLDESRADIRQERLLATAANSWQIAQFDVAYLLRGSQLAQFEEWLENTSVALSDVEHDLIRASVEHQRRLREIDDARKEQESQMQRQLNDRLRYILVILAVFAIVAGLLSYFAFDRANTATIERDRAGTEALNAAAANATAQRNVEESNSLVWSIQAESNLQIAPPVAYGLAINALLVENPSGIVRNTVANTLLQAGPINEFPRVRHANNVNTVQYHPTENLVLTGSSDSTLILWDAITGEPVQQFYGHTDDVQDVAFTADGAKFVSASADGTLIMWDTVSGLAERVFVGHTDAVRTVDISPDQQYVISGSVDETLIVWDFATGDILHILEGHGDLVRSVAFLPDSTQAISAAFGGMILWHIETGEIQREYPIDGTVYKLAISQDGTRVVTGLRDNRVILWDVTTGDEIHILEGHEHRVWSVAYDPTGRYLASGSQDETIIIWDVETGEQVQQLFGHQNRIFSLSFSSDGNTLASGARDTKAMLWDMESLTLKRTLAGHATTVMAAQHNGDTLVSISADDVIMRWDIGSGNAQTFYPDRVQVLTSALFTSDGERVITGSETGNLQLRSTVDGQVLSQLGAYDDAIRALALSPDGQQVIMASGSSITISSLDNMTQAESFIGHNGEIIDLAMSPDGQFIVSSASDQTVRVWNTAGYELVYDLREHADIVTDIAISADSQYLLTGSADQTAILWHLPTGEIVRDFVGHDDRVTVVAFDPLNRVVTGSSDATVIIWDRATGLSLSTFAGHSRTVSSLAFSADGLQMLSGSSDQSVILWQTVDETQLNAISNEAPVLSVTFSPDGQRMAAGLDNRTLAIWDTQSGDLIHTLDEHAGPVQSVAFSPDGQYIASGTVGGLIVWDVETGQALRSLTGFGWSVKSVSFSADGSLLLMGSDDATVILWDVATGEVLQTFEGHTDDVNSVAFSPDQQRIVSGDDDDIIFVHDVTTGEIIHTLDEHSNSVTAVSYSPDGTLILSASEDGTLMLWDAETGNLLQVFSDHTDDVVSAAFSPDGTWFVSGAEDASVIIWDIANGEAIRMFVDHTETVTTVAVHPDGLSVLTGSEDASIIQWRIDSVANLYHLARESRLLRELTCEERELYNINPCDDNIAQFLTATPYPTLTPRGDLTPLPEWTPIASPTATTEQPLSDAEETYTYDDFEIALESVARASLHMESATMLIEQGAAADLVINVYNNSGSSVSMVEIDDLVLPAFVSYVAHDVSSGVFDAEASSWQIDNMDANSVATMTLTVNLPENLDCELIRLSPTITTGTDVETSHYIVYGVGHAIPNPVVVADGTQLNEAIVRANTEDCNVGSNTIHLRDGDYSLTTVHELPNNDGQSGLASVTSEITIDGNNQVISRAETARDFRIVHVGASGLLVLKDVTVTNGDVMTVSPDSPFRNGGGIFNRGTVILDNTILRENAAHNGGAIRNEGMLYATVSNFVNNVANFGGGIGNVGIEVLLVNNTQVVANTANVHGGGIFNRVGSTLIVDNSLISENIATENGGGLSNEGYVYLQNNSEISNNVANFDGGGIYHEAYTLIVASDSRIIGNNAILNGGGIWNGSDGIVNQWGEILDNRCGNTDLVCGSGIWIGQNGQLANEGRVEGNLPDPQISQNTGG